MQGNGQARMQGNGQSRLQGNVQSRMQPIGQFGMQGNGHSRMQYQSRQIHHREPEHYVEDFDDFEELDENFPVIIRANVDDLEFSIRRDLEFKYRMLTRLNDLGGNKYKKSIRLKMKYLFTDRVLEKYSWRGTSEKRPFKKLKSLNNLILRSVRDRFPNTARDEYNDYMIQWLKHARSRQRKVTYTYPTRGSLNRTGSSDDDSEDENMS
ncbi:uncharacterized protein LOC119082931 [Bradysia coprophila]|uniref:uncharacterized protein LOC119082931 n=1 Tax=Bradysia coprophila TaxID=38358 RepID=UPI00187DA563|nr:uncharacterized protein LOC119082931 [Bradysia coprophila]